MKQKTPYIGITLDSEEKGGYSKFPWYGLRKNYCSSISQLGALPIPLPHDLSKINLYSDLLDGLIITGGDFDINPALYGEKNVHDTVHLKSERTEFEMTLTEKFLQLDKPVLGICGGHQLLNVILGGTLIQHIPDEIETSINHEQPNPRNEAGHDVTIKSNTYLHRIINQKDIPVNSAHHQAIKEIGSDVIINAVALDGIVEGIECPKYKFCMGIQWHPEFIISSADTKLFQEFINQSS